MSREERMADVIEAGMELRRMDIDDGRKLERERIINLLNAEASEWLSHDGECDCRYKGDEVLRLIKKIEESK